MTQPPVWREESPEGSGENCDDSSEESQQWHHRQLEARDQRQGYQQRKQRNECDHVLKSPVGLCSHKWQIHPEPKPEQEQTPTDDSVVSLEPEPVDQTRGDRDNQEEVTSANNVDDEVDSTY